MTDLAADLMIANAEIKQLKAQLTESQRRADAAVEDMKRIVAAVREEHCDERGKQMRTIMSCPFCNGEATVGANEYYDGANAFYIYCTSCCVQQMTTKIRTDEVIAAWWARQAGERAADAMQEL